MSLLPIIGSAYALQAVFASIFVPRKSEMYYDLCGALGWMTTTFISLYYPALKDSVPSLSVFAPRQLLVTAAVNVWIIRLGTFLTWRAVKSGGDTRFIDVKGKPLQFTIFWLAQATWISLVGLPVYLCNVLPSTSHPPLGIRDYAALCLYAGSLFIEIMADKQKSAWRRRKDAKQHDEKFITSGLWSISRHPNYLGEIGVWTGIWALSTAALEPPTFGIGALSPLFTWFLIRHVSGVPPLEKAGDMKFGQDPKWHEYKRTVPILWPFSHATLRHVTR